MDRKGKVPFLLALCGFVLVGLGLEDLNDGIFTLQSKIGFAAIVIGFIWVIFLVNGSDDGGEDGDEWEIDSDESDSNWGDDPSDSCSDWGSDSSDSGGDSGGD